MGAEKSTQVYLMSIYKKHVFVCLSGQTCPTQGSQEVFDTLKEKIKSKELSGSIRINRSGCLAQCGNGPMIVVYPESTWYAHVAPSDCQEIVDEHLVNDNVVNRLVYQKRS
jgi:NADP-reducing hydrogenase subunit HndC